jgi:hypothetical protein
MFEVEEHGRDDNEQAGGSQQGVQSPRWFTYCEGCTHIRIIARHGFKLSGEGVWAQLVAGHRAE